VVWPAGDVRYRGQVASSSPEAPTTSRNGSPGDPQVPITVLADRVLVQVTEAEGERRSRAGILIPATAQVSRRLTWAEAVAVGPHVRTIKVKDKVLFNPEDRFEVEVQGDEYVILRERDIHAVASERIDGGTGLYL
jgi:chaperonin GroES